MYELRLSAYPSIVASPPELADDVGVYVIKPYPLVGVSVLINRNTQYKITFGDFQGKKVDPLKLDKIQLNLCLGPALAVVKMARISDSLWFFSAVDGKWTLVDVQKNATSFIGPGMLRDL